MSRLSPMLLDGASPSSIRETPRRQPMRPTREYRRGLTEPTNFLSNKRLERDAQQLGANSPASCPSPVPAPDRPVLDRFETDWELEDLYARHFPWGSMFRELPRPAQRELDRKNQKTQELQQPQRPQEPCHPDEGGQRGSYQGRNRPHQPDSDANSIQLQPLKDKQAPSPPNSALTPRPVPAHLNSNYSDNVEVWLHPMPYENNHPPHSEGHPANDVSSDGGSESGSDHRENLGEEPDFGTPAQEYQTPIDSQTVPQPPNDNTYQKEPSQKYQRRVPTSENSRENQRVNGCSPSSSVSSPSTSEISIPDPSTSRPRHKRHQDPVPPPPNSATTSSSSLVPLPDKAYQRESFDQLRNIPPPQSLDQEVKDKVMEIGKLKDFLRTRTNVIGEEFEDLKLRLRALEEDAKQVPELAEKVQNVNKKLETQPDLASELKALEQWVVPRVVELEKETMMIGPAVGEMIQKLDALEAVVDMIEHTQPGRQQQRQLEAQKVTETPGLDDSSSTDSNSEDNTPRKNTPRKCGLRKDAPHTSDSKHAASKDNTPKHDTPKHGQTKPRIHKPHRQDSHSERPPTQNRGPKTGAPKHGYPKDDTPKGDAPQDGAPKECSQHWHRRHARGDHAVCPPSSSCKPRSCDDGSSQPPKGNGPKNGVSKNCDSIRLAKGSRQGLKDLEEQCRRREEEIEREIKCLNQREEERQRQRHRLDQQPSRSRGKVLDAIRRHEARLDAEHADDKRRHDELQLERCRCQEDLKRARLAAEEREKQLQYCHALKEVEHRHQEQEQQQQRQREEEDPEGQRLLDEFLREIERQRKRREESERRQEEEERSGGFLGQMASTVLGLGIGGLSIYMNGALEVLKPFLL